MSIELSPESWQVLIAFACYLVGVALLGIFSHRYLSRGSFVKEYFLGNRGLGPWVLALTIAATAISGGTFMGFPSHIYSRGWIMALWICSYMVVPLMSMALMGKRINQVARIAGSVTVPDVLRDRFASPALGILSTLLILFFLTVNLVAQFKAGGLVMKEALRLPPAQAAFIGAEVDEGKNLVLEFRLTDGSKETQKTPLPRENARYLPERTLVKENKEVQVFFQAGQEHFTKTVRFPPQKLTLPVVGLPIENGYLIGLLIFAFTVIAYTTYGGFWAVTWTDVLEGLVMLVGVIVMAVLAVRAVPTVWLTSDPDRPLVVPADLQEPEYHRLKTQVKEELNGLEAATETLRHKDAQLVYGPGPGDYLPLGMAFSFFLMWSLMGAGQPSGMVRLMSFKDSPSLRRALLLVCGYYVLTYLALLVIFVCARAIFPTEYLREIGTEGQPDSIMPAMTRKVAHPLVAGLLLAAPYAAIMSTVAAFLLMISSSLVRDIYQRTINPDVSQRTMKIISYVVTATVGLIVVLGALDPPDYLQDIIVFTGSSQGCCFLVPMLFGLYWRRSTRAGMIAAMLAGFLAVFVLYSLGWIDNRTRTDVKKYEAAMKVHEETKKEFLTKSARGPEPPRLAQWVQENMRWFPGWGEPRPTGFSPLRAGGVDPLVWGLLASLLLGIGVSLATRPNPELVRKYYP